MKTVAKYVVVMLAVLALATIAVLQLRAYISEPESDFVASNGSPMAIPDTACTIALPAGYDVFLQESSDTKNPLMRTAPSLRFQSLIGQMNHEHGFVASISSVSSFDDIEQQLGLESGWIEGALRTSALDRAVQQHTITRERDDRRFRLAVIPTSDAHLFLYYEWDGQGVFQKLVNAIDCAP